MDPKTDQQEDRPELSPAVVDALKRGEPLYVVDALGNGVVPDSPVTVVTDKGEFQYNITNGQLDPAAVEILLNDPHAVLLRRWRLQQ
ncbi:hypothetical protein [Ralstonia pseudosolanacearum]|uniref:Uncharacterized protein n=1 Tax=Ralstonia solanacearum TaxID=305 RepID=A0A0S4VU26_RALSL|nr:hypothetical protein [Ralstonia pseudosolanacearum]CUV26023.1 conserved protein of unknown function [Ralstonia solanacearum]CUV37461.1 conserved protein of unknown function [Ralstonia solanacearum]CUV42695.1 conserved protein of unknown function [Ralstonia solanacearum]CUV64213.1 conserved protein of unknown function [Ralstonia solanacearum]